LIQFKIIVGVVGALLAKHFLDVGTGKWWSKYHSQTNRYRVEKINKSTLAFGEGGGINNGMVIDYV
jgi:hypothetical protein